MIQVQKTNDKVILSITTELDYEDVQDLVLDLQSWLIENNKEDHTKSQAYQEAKAQNDSKNKLEKEMKRVFVDVFDDEYLSTKVATVFKLDALNREIEINSKKLNELKNK